MKIKPAFIIIGIVLVVLGALFIPRLLTPQPGTTSVEGDTITETIAAIDTNATATYSVVLLEGSDAEHESEHIFEALAGFTGIGEVSLNTTTLQLTVAYDDTAIGDSIIREQLVAVGYIAPSVDDATAMELSEDGTVQRIAVFDDGKQFNPYLILAAAGTPIEIEFSAGQECRTVVKFPDLGVEQDISQGGVVALPALEPGQYLIACGGDGNEGTLVVE